MQTHFQISPTLEQQKWFIEQIKAVQAIQKAVMDDPVQPINSAGHKIMPLGKALSKSKSGGPCLTNMPGASKLHSYINNGCKGFAIATWQQPEWLNAVQYRPTNPKSIRQYPNGDFYLSAVPGGQVPLTTNVANNDKLLGTDYNITAVIVRYDKPSKKWYLTATQSTRLPNRARKEKV